MFLPRDAFGDGLDLQEDNGAAPSTASGSERADASTSSGIQARAPHLESGDGSTSSSAGPSTVPLHVSTVLETNPELNDESAPSSALMLRQKMLQQRQKALEKKNSTARLTTNNMVTSNEVPPIEEAMVTPSMWNQRELRSGMGNPASGGLFNSTSMLPPSPVRGHTPSGMLSSASTAAPSSISFTSGMLDAQSFSSMQLANSGAFMIAPEPSFGSRDAESEARRRMELAQVLDERGLCPEYDPNASTGKEETLDIGALREPSQMRDFILSPAPKNADMIECRIVRERSGISKMFPKYTLESDAGVFIMQAKKLTQNKTSHYSITMSKQDKLGKDLDACLGKLRANFLGLEFVCYGTGLNPKKIDASMSHIHALQFARQEMCAIQYSSSMWGSSKPRGPRKMSAVIPHVKTDGERLVCRTMKPESEGLLAMQKAGGNDHLISCFQNKPPKWNEQIGAFVLNFNKRVTQASVKNFQLVNTEDPDTVYLQFGRVDKDAFNMDFRHPFSPFQAFAICLSSFDYKLCCE